MSENQSRGTSDYAKYDAMTTEALEELLRLDSQSPEGQELDGELLLYVMEVLAKRNSENPGKTAQQAWESFEKHYLSQEEEARTAQENAKKSRPRLRRWIVLVAATVILAAIPLTVGARTKDNVWGVVAQWAKGNFSFVTRPNAPVLPEATTTDHIGYSSLQQALLDINMDPTMVPAWIPEGYELDRLTESENPMQKIYVAFFKNEDRSFKVSIRSYVVNHPEQVQVSGDPLEVFEVSGITYYIFANNKRHLALWMNGSWECSISGNLTVEELKLMIDSIGKVE